jgi:hypothetical protein
MNFCENCDNMLYMRISEVPNPKEDSETLDVEDESEETEVKTINKIVYYCRCCNNEYPDLHKKDSCIFKINYNTEYIKKNSFINKYVYDDITLPIAENMKCINADCPGKSKPSIKYIQYDKDDMKYIYICMNCYEAGNPNHIW